MIIVPAIDLLDGKAVRLVQGRYDRVDVFDADPVERAKAFADEGAQRLHVVDLDGARKGAPVQRDIVEQIVRAVSIPVQVGGGIRSPEDARAMLHAGASSVIMGTSAVRDPTMVERACRSMSGQIMVAIDAIDGRVAIEGWVETTEVLAGELASEVSSWGASAILYTDVARDGTRTGPNLDATRRVAQRAHCPVYASGGVGTIEHLRALGDLTPKLAGVIVGRALYAGSFTLAQAMAALLTH